MAAPVSRPKRQLLPLPSACQLKPSWRVIVRSISAMRTRTLTWMLPSTVEVVDDAALVADVGPRDRLRLLRRERVRHGAGEHELGAGGARAHLLGARDGAGDGRLRRARRCRGDRGARCGGRRRGSAGSAGAERRRPPAGPVPESR